MSPTGTVPAATLSTVAQKFEAFAAAEWARIKAEGIVIAQEIETGVEAGASAAITEFEMLVTQLGPFALQTVSNLATAEFNHLSGNEKNNLAVTTVVDNAEQQSISIAAQDASTIVKNAWMAFTGAMNL